MSLMLALSLLLQDDQAAEDLLKKVAGRASTARTLHIKATFGEGRRTHLEVELRTKGAACAATFTEGPRGAVELKCDGRRLAAKGARVEKPELPPEEIAGLLRRAASESILSPFFALEMSAREKGDWRDRLPVQDQVKWVGTEKVAGVDASVIGYRILFRQGGRDLAIEAKAWIDPSKLTVLKRELTAHGQTMNEEFATFAYDVDIPDDEFTFQSPRSLAEGRAAQLRRSVELFMRYTGHVPAKLEDLVTRPEWLSKDVFWPDGGFWLGAKLPDVKYAVSGQTAKLGDIAVGPADRRAVTAPTERLSKHYAARVRLALLAAAVDAFRVTYSDLPRRKADLWEKPAWATVWPDGGFSTPAPVDPWGAPFRIITDVGTVKIVVRDFRDRPLKPADLTADERRALEAGAVARLTADETKKIEALVQQLREEDLDARASASLKILEWGAVAADILDRGIRTETDPEAVAQFKTLRSRIRLAVPAWSAELRPLATTVVVTEDGPQMASNERNASASLKTCTTAQADFRANDRDGDMTSNFWVKDVAGLYGIESGDGGPIRLIEPSIAYADASPGRQQYKSLSDHDEPVPKAGYFFAMLESEDDGTGAKPYDEGGGRGRARFGIIAYPAEYGVSGVKSFIVNSDNTLWWKDLGGETVTVFPADPAADGWRKLD